MKKYLLVIALALVVSGCSTYSANRYAVSTDNVVALRSLDGMPVSVGNFTASTPGESEIMCRAVGPIKTPDSKPFSEFIRKAFVDELRMAEVYSDTAPVTLTGKLENIDFSSAGGTWSLALTVDSSNGESMSVSETYDYTTSFYGETACNQTAQALVPAVQNLVGKVVRSPEFTKLAAR
ncbi:hypothetical protein BTW10_15040 [Chromohalobacter japonicus]|uniref:Type IV secretion system putative lipoprotein virB7 n=1 Tax=Chromohalobacter japonicus TaxID=223900 RepID=A0A1Q8T9R8_9GAMM|nr:lipoprotein [Chromohalobacter japonicus]OLO10358.1 hypothetical protein BTW10_15040 [Chromohalobacter japonicus]